MRRQRCLAASAALQCLAGARAPCLPSSSLSEMLGARASWFEGACPSLQSVQVTVQAGARVQAVADELRQHGLSLQNYASIREQTIGGFTQVGRGQRRQGRGCARWVA